MNKKGWPEGTRAIHTLINVEEQAVFCKQHNMTEEELLAIEYEPEWNKQPLPLAGIIWKLELWCDLVDPTCIRCYPRECGG